MLTFATTVDGGNTWGQGTDLNGYRSGVTYVFKKLILAVGTTGTDLSTNGGVNWSHVDNTPLNAVASKGRNAVWAVGPNGAVVRLETAKEAQKRSGRRAKPSWDVPDRLYR